MPSKPGWPQPGCREGERFAIVEKQDSPRFLSREEFETMKQRNPSLIQLRAGGLVYLTEPPLQA